MRSRGLYFIFGLSVLLSWSCTEIIDIDLDSTYTRLVVYGEITTDTVQHQVELSQSVDYFFNEPPPPVENAVVYVSFADSIIAYEETDPGIYKMPIEYGGLPGTAYTLHISNVDIDNDGNMEEYFATATMPQIAEADSIQLQKFITPFFTGYQVALFSNDPPGPNWYNFKILRNGVLINERLSDYTVQPDEFVRDNYIFGLPVGFLDDDNEDEVISPGDIVTLEINSVTKDYYNFVIDAQSEIFGNNPLFSGPPANVSSNLSEGALGTFTAYSIERVLAIAGIPAFPTK